MTTTPVRVPDRVRDASELPRSRVGLIGIVALIVLIAATGVVLWLALGDDGPPTATFDGEVATYSGPTSFEAGIVTFTFDATEYGQSVAFVIAEIRDDSLTMADLEAYGAENPTSVVPPFIETYQTQFVSDQVADRDIVLTEGRWSIWANTAPGDTDKPHPAVIFEVTAAK